jgi:ubiquitin C-terminal hydrolase
VDGGKATDHARKISGCVKLPKKLNMRPFMVPIAANENIGDTYSLFGVVVHHGTGVETGHYTAFVKTQTHDDIWFHCNDIYVNLYEQDISGIEGFVMFYMRYIKFPFLYSFSFVLMN